MEAHMLKSGRPRHEQISTSLRDRIEGGEYAPDDQFPSESQLGSQFGVSRITVRRALHTLENEQLIYRRQGLGSFVRTRPKPHGLVNLTDFFEDMKRAGLKASSRLIEQGSEESSSVVAAALELKQGEEVFRIDRVRLGDGDAIAFDRTWLPIVYGNLLEHSDLGHKTIYHLLEHEFGIAIVGGRYRMEAVNARADVAEHLGVPWGRALFLIERTSWTVGERRVYFQQRYYRSDLVAFELELKRGPETDTAGSKRRGMPLSEFEPVFAKGSRVPEGRSARSSEVIID
jgi:GntR family transcriptional regulator